MASRQKGNPEYNENHSLHYKVTDSGEEHESDRKRYGWLTNMLGTPAAEAIGRSIVPFQFSQLHCYFSWPKCVHSM
ncbi:hypothetical protein YC2023_122231 [Brassica napus]